MSAQSPGPVLEVNGLHVEFQTGGQAVEAIHGATLNAYPGETVAVVGESGSGKSVTALAVLGLLDNGKATQGEILWEGKDLLKFNKTEMRKIRGEAISMIFQDPMTSLDPLYSIGHQISEAMLLHRDMKKDEAWKEAEKLLGQVGIPDPAKRIKSYPHQLSGGQRQRVMIAIALACQPRLLIADEPTTALDVTVEAQVLALMRDLQAETGVAIMLITHDMGVVAEMADRVFVFYAGEVVESGTVEAVLDHPEHPYTKALLSAIPRPDTPRDRPMPAIPGSVPPLTAMPSGCRFRTRCDFVHDRCVEKPPLVEMANGHNSRCWLNVDAHPEAHIVEVEEDPDTVGTADEAAVQAQIAEVMAERRADEEHINPEHMSTERSSES